MSVSPISTVQRSLINLRAWILLMKETMYELKTKDLKPDACQRCEIDRPDTASTGLPSCSHVSIKASQHRKILWHYAAKSFRKYQSLILSKIPLISLVPGTNEESAQRYPTILRSISGLLFHLELDLGNALFPSGFMSKISSTFISPCMLHVPSSSSSLNCTSHWQAIWLKVRIIKLLDLKLPLSFSHFPASFSLTN